MTYQAIQTKYLCPTNTKGSRIKAFCSRGSVTISFPHDIADSERGRFAAKELIKKFVVQDKTQFGTPPAQNPWNREFVTGCLPDGSECHVFIR